MRACSPAAYILLTWGFLYSTVTMSIQRLALLGSMIVWKFIRLFIGKHFSIQKTQFALKVFCWALHFQGWFRGLRIYKNPLTRIRSIVRPWVFRMTVWSPYALKTMMQRPFHFCYNYAAQEHYNCIHAEVKLYFFTWRSFVTNFLLQKLKN